MRGSLCSLSLAVFICLGQASVALAALPDGVSSNQTAPPAPQSNPAIITGNVVTNVLPASDGKFRISGDMYIKDNLYVREEIKAMNDGFETTLNGQNGLFIYGKKESELGAGVFKHGGNGDVSLAHSSGVMVDSKTTSKLGFNARFRNQEKSEVQLANFDGRGIVAKTSGDSKTFAGTFEHANKATVELAGVGGVGVHATSYGGSYAGRFDDNRIAGKHKTLVTLANGDGVGVDVSTSNEDDNTKDAWSGRFIANQHTTVNLASTTGAAISAMATGKEGWNSDFHHDGVKVHIGSHTGMGVHSQTKAANAQQDVSKTWNAFFGHDAKSAVRLAHGSGTGIASWTFNGDKKWNAVFGHGKPAKSIVRLAHSSGIALASVTNSGQNYNAMFSNAKSQLVQLAGPDGQGIHSVTNKGKSFNTEIVNKNSGTDVNVKIGGPNGEGVYSHVTQGEGAAGRFSSGLGATEAAGESHIELGKGGRVLNAVTGNGNAAKWNSQFTYGKGDKVKDIVQLGGHLGTGLYSTTTCNDQTDTWNAIFSNTLRGAEVKLGHTSGQAIYSKTDSQLTGFNTRFESVKKVTVDVADRNGVAIKAQSTSLGWGSQFSNNGVSEVHLTHGDGAALKARTVQTTKAWTAEISNGAASKFEAGHNDGTAFLATNTFHMDTFAGKVESINGQNSGAESKVHMAHPKGYALLSETSSDGKDSYAGMFSHVRSKTHVKIADWHGHALDAKRPSGDANAGSNKELIRLRSGSIKTATNELYRSNLHLGSLDGNTISSFSKDTAPEVWNTEITHKDNTVRVNLAQGTGRGIASTSTTGNVHNAEFAYQHASNVKLAFSTGVALKSESSLGNTYNAQFSHSASTDLQVAGYEGNVLRSTTKEGHDWNAIFEDVSHLGKKSVVNLVNPNGVAIQAVTKAGEQFNAVLSHDKKASLNLVHGSGLAIDSQSEYVPGNKIPAPGEGVIAAKDKPASEELLQTEEGSGGVSAAFGRYNARFVTKTRSSVHVAKDDGTALEVRSLAGTGSTMTVERGSGANEQHIEMGKSGGEALRVKSMSETQYTAQFSNSAVDVKLAKGEALIHAHLKRPSTQKTKDLKVVEFKNNDQSLMQIRNDGRVILGENKKASLFVSGNTKIEGTLHTVHAGETMNLAEEIVRLRKQNAEMKEMMLTMKAQTEAAMTQLATMQEELSKR